MKPTRWFAAAAAATAVAASFVLVSPSGATSNDTLKVALFYDSDYVDTAEDGGGEAFNVLSTLNDIGADVTKIEGITAADFTTGLAGMPDALVIPELEEDGGLGGDMAPDARAVVKNWVDAGGRLEVFGDSDPWATVNAIFGLSITSLDGDLCDSDPVCQLTAAGQATEFGDGPATLAYNNGTSYGPNPASLPAGSMTIYADPAFDPVDAPAVAVIPQGSGSIVFFAYDWYGIDGDGEEGFDQGWFDALEQSLSVKASVNDVAVAEGATATFTLTLDEAPSQSVVLTYATADGSATAGVDYTSTTGTVTIPAGSTTVTVNVPTLARDGAQGDRVFTLDVAAPYWGLMADGMGNATISDTGMAPPPPPPAVEAVKTAPKFTG
jgi:hypothetical protein